jgi:hypothetical protein
LGRATPGLVSFSFGKPFFRDIGWFFVGSLRRSVKGSPRELQERLWTLGS